MFSDQFGKLITAMVTPFKKDLSLDLEALEKIINSLLETKSSSLLVNGTTGESPGLNLVERLELLRVTKEIAGGKTQVIFGVCLNSTQRAIELAQKAQEKKADAILLISPYYNKPDQRGIYAHFSQIAEQVSLPIMLYDIPGRTGVRISLETLEKLLNKHKNIQAIKESPGSCLDQTVQEIPLLSDAYNFQAYCGDDALTLPLLSLGYVGVVSVASHLVGSKIFEMIDLFLNKADTLAAQKIHRELLNLYRLLFSAPSPGPLKYMLSQKKLCQAYLRLPLVEPEEALKKELQLCLSNLN